MSKLKFFGFPSANLRGILFSNLRNNFSTNSGKSSQSQNTPGMFSKIKNIFTGSSVTIINQQMQQTRGLRDFTLKTPIPQLSSLKFTTSHGNKSDKNLKDGKFDEKLSGKLKYMNVPTKHDDAGFRREWGVKLPEESMDKLLVNEHMPNYVLKRKWGVKLWEPVNLDKEIPKKAITNPQIPIREIESSDLTSTLEKQFMDSLVNDGIKMKSENPPPIIDSGISVVPPIGEEVDPLKPTNEETNLLMAKKKLPLNESEPLTIAENPINAETHDIINDISKEDELTAWRQVTDKTNLRIKQMEDAAELRKDKEERFDERFSIIPEPPSPKIDIAAVKPVDSNSHETSTVFDNKNFLGQMDTKKFHTLSFLFLCYSVESPENSEVNKESDNSVPLEVTDSSPENSEDLFEESSDDNEEEAPAYSEETDETKEAPEEVDNIQNVVRENIPEIIEQKHGNYESKSVDDYVRIPGDPYPFTRKYVEQWQRL